MAAIYPIVVVVKQLQQTKKEIKKIEKLNKQTCNKVKHHKK